MRRGIGRAKEVEDLNLIPLMNLFVTMIPLLLLTAAFYHIGMVSASVPTQSDEESSVETGSTAVTVNLRMSDEGYNVTASSATLGEAELEALDAFVPKKAGKFDYATLTKVLERIKKRYQESETILLAPGKDARYDEIIKTMDAGRSMTMAVDGRKRRLTLFPIVVITSLVE